MTTKTYTTIAGEVIEYPDPAPEVAAFLARAIQAANDPTVSETELVELLYGKENPILDQTVFPGRGAVTPVVFRDPLYQVVTDLIAQKQVLTGRLVPERDLGRYSMTVPEAARELGVSTAAVRAAVAAEKIAAIKPKGRVLLDPASVRLYGQVSKPRGRQPSKPRRGRLRAEEEAAEGPMRASASPHVDAEDLEPPGTDPPPGGLAIRMGSVEGRSLSIKAPGVVVVGKDGHLRDAVSGPFERAAIRITGPEMCRTLILEARPDEDPDEYAFGPFYVRGRFEIVEKVNNPRRAAEVWKGFEAE